MLALSLGADMRRREFISVLGGVAAWPLAARAQQTAVPVIGFLSGGSPAGYASSVVGFRNGLNEAGFVEGRNVAVDYRWMDGHFDRLPEAASDLVRRRVAVIFASGGVVSAIAAKAATSTIPIVFVHGSDPIKFGLVASLNHPGGNVTGVGFLQISLERKRLELLREMVPKGSVIAVLLNPNNPNADGQLNDVQTAATTLDQPIVVLKAATDRDLEATLAALVQQQINAFAVTADSFLYSRLNEIVTFAEHHRLPTMGAERQFAVTGGLMTYGPNSGDAFRQAGVYTGRILKGERPADLPVMQPTKFEFVINLKTAKALGLEIPPKLLALADEAIE
jgi:putative tryptophan/tyrosine transport system substrate-binding protein